MYLGDLIDIKATCDLLGISRITLQSYRKKYQVSNIKVKREIKFSKNEILNKLYISLNPVVEKIRLNMRVDSNFEQLKIDETTYDLRKINASDGHGAISLLCHLLNEIKRDRYIHILIDKSNTFLKAINFFLELRRHINLKVFWDDDVFNSIPIVNSSPLVKLPIKRIGIVGAQNTLVDDLIIGLSRQGYSRDICSYIGWAMGELADNSATHALTHPCFVYFEQFGEDERYLQFTIGDIGIGIPASLKKNKQYKSLNDREALLTSFKPKVSGRSIEEDRGKGLTDVLKISMECGSTLYVDSNGVGFFHSFDRMGDGFSSRTPLYKGRGTIISILFIDGNFGSVEREDVEKYIDICLERL